VATVTVAEPPVAPKLSDDGLTEYEQVVVAPASVTVTASPATVTVAERLPPVFAATVTATEAGPDPPGPTFTQLAPLDVVHPQPAVVVTVTAAVPPASLKDSRPGLTE
jgi:hypothetical protein